MTDKIKKELENISALIDRLKQWDSLGEKEVKVLVKEFNVIPREEWSSYRVELLRDREVGNILRSIGEKYGTSADILKYVISSIGNLIVRYKLEPSDELYDFFLAHKNNTKVGYYVSLFIFDFPQFESYK
jgi:hypothetical protein